MKANTFLKAFIENAGKPLPSNEHLLNSTKLCGEDELILGKLGFEPHRPDPAEPGYCEHRLRLGNCHALKNVEVAIADTFIDIWVEEQQRGILPGQSVLIVVRSFTWRELAGVLRMLTKKTPDELAA